MTGLEAIYHHNGFAMAAVGITIVFTALVALALIIAQLHKVLLVWENRKACVDRVKRIWQKPGKQETAKGLTDIEGIREPARQFQLLIHAIGEPFSLPRLIKTAETLGIGEPHSTVSRLIECHLIVPDENGFFRWNHDAYNRISGKGGK